MNSVTAKDKPMTAPPRKETTVPTRDMAPFVPGGTGFNFVTRIGRVGDKIPSSEASVSPRQQAKCLKHWCLNRRNLRIIEKCSDEPDRCHDEKPRIRNRGRNRAFLVNVQRSPLRYNMLW